MWLVLIPFFWMMRISLCHGLTKEIIILYWNTTNPIFRIDNNDNIIDVGSSPMIYDQVNIVCPVYDPGSVPESEAEQFVIYHVNKEEYDTCRIMKPYPRIIAKCNTPFKPRYFTISFRSFSPTPGALEFRPGKDYYFISTSSKEDIHRRLGGSCLSNNMKVVFKVNDKTATTTTTTTSASTTGFIDPYFVRDPLYPSEEDLKKHRRKKPRRKKSKNRILNDETSRVVEPSYVEKVNNLMKQEVVRSSDSPEQSHSLWTLTLALAVFKGVV